MSTEQRALRTSVDAHSKLSLNEKQALVNLINFYNQIRQIQLNENTQITEDNQMFRRAVAHGFSRVFEENQRLAQDVQELGRGAADLRDEMTRNNANTATALAQIAELVVNTRSRGSRSP
ncbi:hypothetical protein NW762_009478 [Fusarium torreyae]|uniref:Uncharacterized protein n=1 Tax=Fusarium torreyae TaxID=1237075 RepID=A0A9W8VBP5_9HYPO|nr:hypothetical protein NW762_009478 [Fusarium torreyae]